MRVGKVRTAACMVAAAALGAAGTGAAAERTEIDFLATVPGMGSLLDLTYGSTAALQATPSRRDPGDGLFLQGLDGIGATIVERDGFRLGLRTRGDVRAAPDGSTSLAGDDMVDIGAFGAFTFDEWTLSASLGQGLLEESGGFAGDFGLKWATQFAEGWRVEVGPVFSWASDDYLDGLSGFTPRRIPGRGLQLYDPTPGSRELTFSGAVEYSISDSWTVGGMIGAQRMVGSSIDSPADEEVNEFFGGVSLGIRF